MPFAKVGKLKVVWSRPLPDEPSSVTIIKDAAGRYFASFVVEIYFFALPESQCSVGIDLGIKTLATLDNGQKIDAPKPLKKHLNRIRRLSKNLSRKTRGSNRYERARKRKTAVKVAATYEASTHRKYVQLALFDC